MSASAEVYITIDTTTHDTRDKIESAVDMALRGLGFDIAADDRYKISRYQSGVIIEAKSYGCAWEIFDQDWAEKLVRGIHELDEVADVELYVYNLDREADLVMRTSTLFSEKYSEKAHA